MIFLLCAATIAINIPFGYIRASHDKFSWQWLMAIHFPVILVVAMRLLSGGGWSLVPLMLACSILGQLLGGMIRGMARGARTDKTILVETDER